jgi:uncharacterized protein YbjT (DUF2867 family)
VLLLVVLVGGTIALTLRASPPAHVFDTAAPPGEPRDPRPVLVFGASGELGLEIVAALRERGQAVTAAVRPTSDRSRLEPLGVSFVVADALEAKAVQAAVSGGDHRAIISTVGGTRQGPPPDFEGNRNIVDATKAAGTRRLILVTTIGAGDSYAAAHILARIALRNVLPLKTQAEDHLRASGLDWTIIRPGGLIPPGRAPTGHGYLSEDRTAFGFIHRADLAQLVVTVLEDVRTIGRTFAAADPTLERPWQ